MNDRKAYVSPAVLTEDVLEQTSLACNSTAPFSTFASPGNFGPGAVGGDADCTINVSKNNAFSSGPLCLSVIKTGGEVIALS